MSDLHDPRVLFAAERTLMAENRTGISLMGFGFVVERFGMFLEIIGRKEFMLFQRKFSFFIGISLILLACFLLFYSVLQYKRILRTIQPAEVPIGYNLWMGMLVNGVVGFIGLILIIYLSNGIL